MSRRHRRGSHKNTFVGGLAPLLVFAAIAAGLGWWVWHGSAEKIRPTPPSSGVNGSESAPVSERRASQSLGNKGGNQRIQAPHALDVSDDSRVVEAQKAMVSSSPASAFPTAKEGVSGGVKRVALTFDAGSNAAAVRSILDTLARKNLRVTFFLTGQFCERFPEESRLIGAAGHEIGNHSFSHPRLTRLTEEGIRDELEKGRASIERATGSSVAMLFRPPFGDRNARTDTTVRSLGYQSVMWTLDSHDSVVKGITADRVAERVLQKVCPGGVVLMHCGSVASAEALPRIIEELTRRGYTIAPVSQVLHR